MGPEHLLFQGRYTYLINPNRLSPQPREQRSHISDARALTIPLPEWTCWLRRSARSLWSLLCCRIRRADADRKFLYHPRCSTCPGRSPKGNSQRMVFMWRDAWNLPSEWCSARFPGRLGYQYSSHNQTDNNRGSQTLSTYPKSLPT